MQRAGTKSISDPRTIGLIELYFFADGDHFEPPSSFQLQYLTTDGWKEIPKQTRAPQIPIADGDNRVAFTPLRTQQLRMIFTNATALAHLLLIEVKAFAL